MRVARENAQACASMGKASRRREKRAEDAAEATAAGDAPRPKGRAPSGCTWDGETATWVNKDGSFHSEAGAVTQRRKEVRQVQREAAEYPISIEGYSFSREAFDEIVFDGVMAVWKRLKEDDAVGAQVDERLLSKFNTLDKDQLREMLVRFAVLFSGHFVVDEGEGEEGQAEGKVAVEQVLASRRAEVVAFIMQP